MWNTFIIQRTMVIISDGNSKIGAHVRSNLFYLICLRLLIRLKANQEAGFVKNNNSDYSRNLAYKISIILF